MKCSPARSTFPQALSSVSLPSTEWRIRLQETSFLKLQMCKTLRNRDDLSLDRCELCQKKKQLFAVVVVNGLFMVQIRSFRALLRARFSSSG